MNLYHTLRKYKKLLQRIEAKQKLAIAVVDVENALSNGQSAAIFQARQLLEKNFDLVICITDNPEESLIDSQHYEKSTQIRAMRPRPHLLAEDDLFTYVPPEQHLPTGLLNPDIIVASSGTRILPQLQHKLYKYDLEYESQYLPTWYADTLSDLQDRFPLFKFHNQVKSLPTAYELGQSKFFPHQYKIQINFKSSQQLQKFRINHQNLAISNWYMTNDSNPLTKDFTCYLTPLNYPKAAAINHITNKLMQTYNLESKHIELFLIGDSLPDLHLALHTNSHIPSTLLIVGESPLFPYVAKNYHSKFAGDPIKETVKQLKTHSTKKIIVGDRSYPGTKGPETIIAYLLRNQESR